MDIAVRLSSEGKNINKNENYKLNNHSGSNWKIDTGMLETGPCVELRRRQRWMVIVRANLFGQMPSLDN